MERQKGRQSRDKSGHSLPMFAWQYECKQVKGREQRNVRESNRAAIVNGIERRTGAYVQIWDQERVCACELCVREREVGR